MQQAFQEREMHTKFSSEYLVIDGGRNINLFAQEFSFKF